MKPGSLFTFADVKETRYFNGKYAFVPFKETLQLATDMLSAAKKIHFLYIKINIFLDQTIY